MHMTVDHPLGHLIGEFGWSKKKANSLLGAWIFLVLASLVLSIFLIGIPILIYSLYNLYQTLTRLFSKQSVILLYQQGLVDCRKDPPRTIAYQDIKNIYLSVKSAGGVINYVVRLETDKQGKIKIDEHIANVDQLRTLLEQQFVEYRFPGAIAAYQQGTPIEFAELQLTQSGLVFGKKTLPWAEVNSVDIYKQTSVFVRVLQNPDKKEWFAKNRDYFPNMALFFALVDAIQRNP